MAALMRGIVHTFLALLLLSCSGLAIQYKSLSFRIGVEYGSYGHGRLHESQQELVSYYSTIDIPLKIVDSFPGNRALQVQLLKEFSPRIQLGLFYGEKSTGGKVHYADYSGEIEFIQKISQDEYGLLGEYKLIEFGVLSIAPVAKFSFSNTFITIDNSFMTTTDLAKSHTTYRAMTLGMEPGISLKTSVGKLLFQTSLSYHLNISTKFKGSENVDGGLPYWPNWSGYRVSLMTGWDF